jgi:hypothetical protein
MRVARELRRVELSAEVVDVLTAIENNQPFQESGIVTASRIEQRQTNSGGA